MKDLNLAVEDDRDARAFALLHFGTEGAEERFDIPPPDVARHRMSEDGRKRLLVPAVHTVTSITFRY